MTLSTTFRTHTVERRRPTRTSDGAGGWSESMGAAATLVGSLQPAGGPGSGEGEAADQERAKVDWRFYADPDGDVLRDDVLTWEGRDFTVVGVLPWSMGSTLDFVRCDLEEIQHGR